MVHMAGGADYVHDAHYRSKICSEFYTIPRRCLRRWRLWCLVNPAKLLQNQSG